MTNMHGGVAGRPVVALDVDGVLNRLGTRAFLPSDVGYEGWEIHPLNVPAEFVPRSPFIQGHGEYALLGSVVVNPGLHGPWITELRKVADVVWATTWEGAANIGIAPTLGIEPLEVGISTAEQLPKFSMETDEWKAYSLEKVFRGRPLCWVDDMNWRFNPVHRFGREFFSRDAEGREQLVITCEPDIGLTVEDMDRINMWVRERSAA